MKLVLLAAGHGSRFGGLKQIAPVGPRGEAIMDHTVQHAEEAGYEGVVVVVREEIRDEIARHVRSRWPIDLPVELVCQSQRPGTAYAVLCTRQIVDGPFAVANADDLYERDALVRLRDHFAPRPAGAPRPDHVLVAYELARTILSDAEVKRGVCTVGANSVLGGVVEHRVRRSARDEFAAAPLAATGDDRELEPSRLSAMTPVSMNLWGFDPSVYDLLDAAVARFEPAGPEREILLPEVIGSDLAAGRTSVQVVRTASYCYGVTHREDVVVVRKHLEGSHGMPRRACRATEAIAPIGGTCDDAVANDGAGHFGRALA